MIRLTTPVTLTRERHGLEQVTRLCDSVGMRTICGATGADWADQEVAEVRRVLDDHGIRVGEFAHFPHGLGSPDQAENREALRTYRKQFEHARLLDAHCVGFSYSGRLYAQPDTRSEATWARVVAAARELAGYAAEVGLACAAHPHLMGPLYSVERMVRLIREVGSPCLKVLADPCNFVTPDHYFDTTALIDTTFDSLGEHVVAIHAKDVRMAPLKKNEYNRLPICHIYEVLPGDGLLDYPTLLRRTRELGREITFNVEHLAGEDEVVASFQFVRGVAAREGIPLS